MKHFKNLSQNEVREIYLNEPNLGELDLSNFTYEHGLKVLISFMADETKIEIKNLPNNNTNKKIKKPDNTIRNCILNLLIKLYLNTYIYFNKLFNNNILNSEQYDEPHKVIYIKNSI
ncbi:3562_t:CDS:2 [Gigaspora rosea]|nr:3562_t:CDS:2 [Gigaspora rosea]